MPTQVAVRTKTFLATTGNGLSRATADRVDGSTWQVEQVLQGRDVRCLAADPLHGNAVYAGTNTDGVLRSDDGGLTWVPAGLSGHSLRALAVSPLEPSVVYAGTRPRALYVSRDRGVSWTEIESFRRIRGSWWWFSPAEWPPIPYVQGIALSPTDPHTILVGIESGAVVRSADGGRTWTGHLPGAMRDCHTITFHPTDGRYAYEGGTWLGTGAGGISRDGGRTWTSPRTGQDRFYGWAAAGDGVHPEVWYCSASPGAFKAHSDSDAQAVIYRSRDGGPWQPLAGGLPQPLNYMPYALLPDPHAAGHLGAGLSNGDVWQTEDFGDTWRKLPFSLGAIVRSLVMLP